MSRNTRLLIDATLPIIAALYGQHNRAMSPDDAGGGGTATDDKGKAKVAEAKKIELTEDELTARISAATEAAVKKAEEKAAADQKKKEDADAKEADRKKGEFQKLYDGEVARTKQLEAEAKAKDEQIFHAAVALRLNRYLADNHAEYVGAVDTIFATLKVEPDAKDADVDKAIKTTVDDFVKKFKPATTVNRSGAPAGGVHNKVPSNAPVPENKNNEQPRRRFAQSTWHGG